MNEAVSTDITQALELARDHYNEGRLNRAESVCKQVLEAAPGRAKAVHLLGLVAYKRGEHGKANNLVLQAIQKRPNFSEFHNSLGMIYMALGEPAKAIDAYQATLQYFPPGNESQLPMIYGNMANAMQVLGRFDEAIEFHGRALKLNPDDHHALWNRSHIYLLRGEFEKGWEGYEHRFALKNSKSLCYPYRLDPDKRWDGTEFQGKRLFVHDEQGFGDIINFGRYLPMAKARGGTLIFETRPALIPLFEDYDCIDELYTRNRKSPNKIKFDYYIPLLSLPRIFGTRLETIPAEVPYYRADPGKMEYWRRRFTDISELKVGLAWAGNLDNIMLRHRSFRLRRFARVLPIPGVQFIGLQKGDQEAQVKEIPAELGMLSIGNEFDDFGDTAAAIANLDLVVTIDTAVAHMAGALGKPTWLLLSHPPDFRWLLERDDCPWYPTMRVFRQRAHREWDAVFQRVADELRSLVSSR